VHAEPSHWLHEISISKTIRHHFLPGRIPPLEIGGTYMYIYVICNILKWFVECEPFGKKKSNVVLNISELLCETLGFWGHTTTYHVADVQLFPNYGNNTFLS